MGYKALKSKPFPTDKSIKKADALKGDSSVWTLESEGKQYKWTNRMERVNVIREGIPYASIEGISERLNKPVKNILSLAGIPQTTYNKKKSERAMLDSRESEWIVLLTELLDYGLLVFNHEEEKFQRWLTKPNLSLGGISPENLLDTATGIEEVYACLVRIEFGNFA